MTKSIESKNINIARELKELTDMPGWEHLKSIMDSISLGKYVGVEDLKGMLNDNILAYNVGKKDGLIEFFNAVYLTIYKGNQILNDNNSADERRVKDIVDKEAMNNKHGYF